MVPATKGRVTIGASYVFYFLSKTAGQLTNIGLVYGATLVVLIVLLFFRRVRRFSLGCIVAVNALAILITVFPVGSIISQKLETRFAKPNLEEIEFSGIITLSGSVDPKSFLERGEMHVGASADRIFEMLRLASLYPEKPVIFTGGDGNLSERGFSEAAVLKHWLDDSGLITSNMHFEMNARNTHENAVNSMAFIYGNWPHLAQKPWVLITSASHMPRAVGTFRQAGWNIIPYPVDRLTSDHIRLASLNVSGGINSLSRGLREWVGLTAYYWTGRTDEWFPGPSAEVTEN